MMKFFGILLMSMVAHITNGKHVKFQVENAGSSYNKDISIDRTSAGTIQRTRVQQRIMADDDWTIDYIIQDDQDDIELNSTSLCNAEPSSQGANVVDLLIEALGVADEDCPIRTQTVEQPGPVIEGELEIDGHDAGEKIYLEITLKKGYAEIVRVTLAGGVEENRR